MNPGSKEAIEAGCTCPVMDNNHGKGILINGQRQFWYSGDCLLHGMEFKNLESEHGKENTTPAK